MSSSATNNKRLLENRLAIILNVGDDEDHEYISDVLDQLIAIGDDPNDVAEYLSSFVAAASPGSGDGDNREDVQAFSNDVRRFKLGEDISAGKSHNNALLGENNISQLSIGDQKPKAVSTKTASARPSNRILDEGAAKRAEIKKREMEARERQREEQEKFKQKKEEEDRRRREMEVAAAAAKKKDLDSSALGKFKGGRGKKAGSGGKSGRGTGSKRSGGAKQSVSEEGTKGSEKQSSSQAAPTKKNEPINHTPKKPPKGEPTIVCGCYGNKHKPLTNCLHCGRISCEREGYDYCPFCGHLIEDFVRSAGNSASIDKATAHKERLLEFDRNSAARTKIFDDQEDYFVTATSMWSTQEEQEDAAAKEEERYQKLHQRQKQVLNINF